MLLNRSVPLGQWLHFAESDKQTSMSLIDAGRQDVLLNLPLEWNPQPWIEDSGVAPLEPLDYLALFGMLVVSY